MRAFSIRLASNYVENIRRYTIDTAGDGTVMYSRPSFMALCEKGVSKTALTQPAKMLVEQQALKGFLSYVGGSSALGQLVKAINGTVVGILFDVLVNLLFDPTGKALRAAFRAGVEAGANAVAGSAQTALDAVAASNRDVDGFVNSAHLGIDAASDQAELDLIVEAMNAFAASIPQEVNDTTLHDEMLERWLLQRAGDEEDANKATDPEAYAKVHDKIAPDGNLARRDLFVHQCEYAWGRYGIDSHDALTEMRRRLSALRPDIEPEDAVEQLGPIAFEFEKFSNPRALPDALRRYGGTAPFDLRLHGAGMETEGLPDTDGLAGMPRAVAEAGEEFATRLAKLAASGGVRMRCAVDLTEADGAIFVDRYRFKISGTRHFPGGDPIRPKEPSLPPHDWEESPD